MYVCISLLTQRCPKRICTCFLGPWPSGVRRPWALVRSGGSADQLWRSQGWKGRRRTTTAAAATTTRTTTTTINQNENQIQNHKKKNINNNNNKQQQQGKEEEQQRQEQEQEQEQQQQQQQQPQQQEQRQPQQRQAQAHRQQPQGAAKPLFLGRAPPADGWGRRIYIYTYEYCNTTVVRAPYPNLKVFFYFLPW